MHFIPETQLLESATQITTASMEMLGRIGGNSDQTPVELVQEWTELVKNAALYVNKKLKEGLEGE